MSLGHKVRELREKKGWSQTDLGELIKKSQARISDIENNKVIPDWTEIQSIAQTLEVPITHFLTSDSFAQYNQDHGSGFMFVTTLNYNHYVSASHEQDLDALKAKIKLLEDQIHLLTTLIGEFLNKNQ